MRPAIVPVCQVRRVTPYLPDQVGDLLIEGTIFGAAEHYQDVGQPEQGAGLVIAEDRCSCRQVWAA